MNMQTEAAGPETPATIWRPSHAYLMAVVCLVIGVAIGYLVRGSAPPKPVTTAAAVPKVDAPSPSSTGDTAPPATPTLDDMKRMAEKQAQPLLTELQKKPDDAALLNKTALTYKAAHQFDKAAEYFKKSLDSDPKNVAVRDDYASCLYYTGDVDGAIAQLQKSLTYDPKHPGTLYNLGMIEWKGKGNADAAVAAWEKLLKLNPNLRQKEQIQHMIEMVKQNKATVAEKQ
jgi:cytochrome c-type biogenesis protein CcmH/NrfG